MAHPIKHSENAVKKWGGVMEDYLPIHTWFDESKALIADWRHRALRHHAQGIFDAETIFGSYITNSDGKKVPVRYIGEQHVMEDLGFIPTFQDYVECMSIEKWMGKQETHRRIKKDKERKKKTNSDLSFDLSEEIKRTFPLLQS
jgi:hypothetical protein